MTESTPEEQLSPEVPATEAAPEAAPAASEPLAAEPVAQALPYASRASLATNEGHGSGHLWLAGTALALLGVGLAVAPHVSASAARTLAPLRAPEIYGGLLITAGLVLFIGGVLRRALSGIHGSLADLNAETARLDQVSHDTQNLCMTLEQVQQANTDSKAALANLQKRIERLTEIASDPDHTVSMFRLAASVDQLGARLDLFIKDQFKNMSQQLGGAVAQAQQIERNLIGRLTELETQVGAQLGTELAAQRQALTEGFERSASSTARASTGIEANLTAAARIEAQLAEHKKALSGAFESQAAGRASAVARIEARLAEQKQSLGEAAKSLDAQFAESKRTLAEAAKGIDAQFAESKRALAEATKSFEARLAEHKKALGVAAESLAAEQVKAVVHIEGRFAEQQQALAGTVQSLGADQLAATAALHESLTGLGQRFEQHLQEQTSYVAECLGQLDGALERAGHERDTVTREVAGRVEQQLAEHAVVLQQRLAPMAECLGHIDNSLERSGREHEALTRETAAHLEQKLAEHASGLQLDLAPLAEAAVRTTETGKQVHALLADLEAHVIAQVQNLQIALAEGLERTRVASSETYEAATEGLSAAARLEARVHECQENLGREAKAGQDRHAQSHTVNKRIEIEIAANSSRLERIADELRGLASLALEIRDARHDEPAASPLVTDPPPALPMSRDSISDVVPGS